MTGDRSAWRPYSSPDLVRARLADALERAERAEAERDHYHAQMVRLRAGIHTAPHARRRFQLP